MVFRTVFISTFLLFVPEVSVQTPPLLICTVQPAEGFGHAPPGGLPDWGGHEALELARELSTHHLVDGTPIQATAVIRKTRQESRDEAERRGCPFIVELWWHDSVDRADVNAPPGTPSTQLPGQVLVGDRTMIEYSLSRGGSRKELLGGAAPPAVMYKGGTWSPSPYPLFATQILKKLNSTHPR